MCWVQESCSVSLLATKPMKGSGIACFGHIDLRVQAGSAQRAEDRQSAVDVLPQQICGIAAHAEVERTGRRSESAAWAGCQEK